MTAAGTPGGTAYTTMADSHGDLVAAFSPTSTATGLAGSSSYSPYGTKTATGYPEDLGYQGDYTDPVTGLVYMNARWYNPAAGAFVSSDTANGSPILSTVDGNPYAYTDGNPLAETDPTGHSCMFGSSADCWGWGCIGWAILCGAEQLMGPSSTVPSWDRWAGVSSTPSCNLSGYGAPPNLGVYNPPSPGGGGGGGGGGGYGCGTSCQVGVGIGVVAFCVLFPEACVAPAAPAAAVAAPVWLLTQVIVTVVRPTDVKNPNGVKQNDRVTDNTPKRSDKTPNGTKPSDGDGTGSSAAGQVSSVGI